MNHISGLAEQLLRAAEEQSKHAEQQARERAGKRDALQFVRDEHGADVAALLSPDFSFAEYATGFSDEMVHRAKRRLALCAQCPSHGGACAGEYEQERGRAPAWSSEKGLHFAWCERWNEYLVRERLERVGVGKRLLGARFETFAPRDDVQREALRRCTSYAARFDRASQARGLMIAGRKSGVGKTHLAVSVLAALIATRKLRSALFAYVPEFLERVRRSYSEPTERGLMDRAMRVDMLVLDDLGAQRTTEWVQEQINVISDARWSNGRPTIITTNVSPDEIAATIGHRAASRLVGDVYGIEVSGEDQRWQR